MTLLSLTLVFVIIGHFVPSRVLIKIYKTEAVESCSITKVISVAHLHELHSIFAENQHSRGRHFKVNITCNR